MKEYGIIEILLLTKKKDVSGGQEIHLEWP